VLEEFLLDLSLRLFLVFRHSLDEPRLTFRLRWASKNAIGCHAGSSNRLRDPAPPQSVPSLSFRNGPFQRESAPPIRWKLRGYGPSYSLALR